MLDGSVLPITRGPKGSTTAVLRNWLARASTKFGYDGMPPALVRYLLLVSVAGVLAPFLFLPLLWEPLTARDVVYAVVLLAKSPGSP